MGKKTSKTKKISNEMTDVSHCFASHYKWVKQWGGPLLKGYFDGRIRVLARPPCVERVPIPT